MLTQIMYAWTFPEDQQGKHLPATLQGLCLHAAGNFALALYRSTGRQQGPRGKTRTKQLLSGNKKGKKRSHFIFVLMESVTGCLMSFLSKDLLLSRSCPKTHAVFSRPLSLSFLDKQKAAGIWNLFQESRVQICMSPSPGLIWGFELFENLKTAKQQHGS